MNDDHDEVLHNELSTPPQLEDDAEMNDEKNLTYNEVLNYDIYFY